MVPLRPRQSNVCAFLIHGKSKFFLFCSEVITDKDLRRKLMISGGQKETKACLNLACVAWRFKRQFDRERTQHDCLEMARLCRLV